MELYASLRDTNEKLMSMGQKPELPSTTDLRIMNVANMTPNQLLQLCAENKSLKYGIDQYFILTLFNQVLVLNLIDIVILGYFCLQIRL